ncbi:hypothetical protein CFN78_28135 [Amycolatopsis antarctica]|uniref:DUF3307 domain-containing protein n=2 Tax=Amycolatopsis antarctica TaxID=1854586 RepID=A0A263CXU5_9PSEU|nr:hypothetical protein CFN78_28135 [Amycolatopsis antarctica]
MTATAAGHEVGDFLEQPDAAARGKQLPGRVGRRALHRHVAGLTVCQLVMTAGAVRATGLRVPVHAVLAGQAVNSVTHWIIDRGPLLRWYADFSGKRGFHDAAAGGVNGRMLMDQACHKGVLPVAAAVTALLARRAVRR